MDAYIADCTSEMRPKMEQMRRILQEALPDAPAEIAELPEYIRQLSSNFP